MGERGCIVERRWYVLLYMMGGIVDRGVGMDWWMDGRDGGWTGRWDCMGGMTR